MNGIIAMSANDPSASPHDSDSSAASSASISMHEASRRQKLKQLIELGVDPWGGRFDNRMPIAQIRSRAGEVQFRSQSGTSVPLPELTSIDIDFRQWLASQGPGELEGPAVRAAGRIVLKRDAGKLKFVDLRDQTGQIQLLIGKKQVGETSWQLAQCFDLGDIVGVDGSLTRTQMGELTILARQLHFLTKSLEPPPEKHHGLHDPELRQRMRYVDLFYGQHVLGRFQDRTRIIQSIRQTLDRLGFLEIEGPTLHAIAGGAAARPFTTHHNTLDLDLYLRIALELHLKRLLVGGMERVYELGRVYRNEGISPKHNPEYTMLEVYEAFGNYETMIELAEQLIVDAVDALGRGRQLAWGEAQIDFAPPFPRKTYHDLLAEHTGVLPEDQAQISALAAQLGIETANRHPDVVKNELFEQKVEGALDGPIFVIDYPASICPLTKRKAGEPHIAERFELFIQGMEIANAYTELNDPDLQQELLRTQLAGLPEEESMARMDHVFIRALRHGWPPAGGLGIGIDRLIMLLTNTRSIRDVILFPLMRPESG